MIEVKSNSESRVRPKTSKKKTKKSANILKDSKEYYPQIIELKEEREDNFSSEFVSEYSNFIPKQTSSLLHSASRL